MFTIPPTSFPKLISPPSTSFPSFLVSHPRRRFRPPLSLPGALPGPLGDLSAPLADPGTLNTALSPLQNFPGALWDLRDLDGALTTLGDFSGTLTTHALGDLEGALGTIGVLGNLGGLENSPGGFGALQGALEALNPVLEASSVLAAVVLVHEAGHFLAATLQRIHVSKFAIGFGPVLLSFVSNNVEFSLRAFPLGGFVGFPDDDPSSDIPPDDPDLLRNRPVLDRVLVISAGVVANIIFAYFLIFTQVVTVGLPVQEQLPGVLVPEVRTGSAAARDGLLAGDIILGANGVNGPTVFDLVDLIKMNARRRVELQVVRQGKGNVDVSVVPDESSDGTGRIGVQLSPNFRVSKVFPKNLAEATVFASREFVGLSLSVLDGLKQTFLNFSQTASKVSGPVAIIAVGAEVARSSADGLFQFAAVINLNLAVINILPLPALDGGSLALVLVEAVRGGRKLPKDVEQRIMSSGFLLVLVLGLFLIVRDTLNLDFIKEIL